MRLMAKSKPEKKMGRPALSPEEKAKRKGKSYTLWLPPETWDQVKAFKRSLPYDTSYKTHFLNAIQEYLERKEFWPPPGNGK